MNVKNLRNIPDLQRNFLWLFYAPFFGALSDYFTLVKSCNFGANVEFEYTNYRYFDYDYNKVGGRSLSGDLTLEAYLDSNGFLANYSELLGIFTKYINKLKTGTFILDYAVNKFMSYGYLILFSLNLEVNSVYVFNNLKLKSYKIGGDYTYGNSSDLSTISLVFLYDSYTTLPIPNSLVITGIFDYIMKESKKV